MEIEEIDYDNMSLEDPIEVGTEITKPVEPTPEVEIDEVKPEPKKRGPKPKVKDESEPVQPEPEPEEEVKELPGEEESSLIQTMADKMGIEIPEGMEFEDTEDGLVEFNEFIADKRADDKLNEWLTALPPIASDFFDYLQMAGEDATEDKIKAFFTTVNPEIDYKSVDLTKDEIQKTVMRQFFKKMDYTDEEIKEAIDDLEIAGTLEKSSKIASTKLATAQEKERNILLERQKQEDLERKQNTQKFFGSVKNIIESGVVNNFTIPVTERKGLFEYDANGQFMKDINNILKDPASRTELALAVKNKFNLAKFTKIAAQTMKANSLRDKLKSSNGRLKGGNNGDVVSNNQIDWDNIYTE